MFSTLLFAALIQGVGATQDLEVSFSNPPDSARPGVYWYFMDGNLNGEEMIKDLDSMKAAGLGNLIFLEVDLGIPRGPVKFMSKEWQQLFVKTVRHAEKIGMDITLGVGPGWSGSGGPWIKPEESMQHLVFSSVEVSGPVTFDEVLPVPEQRTSRFHKMKSDFYEDVYLWAFPKNQPVIHEIDERAFYERRPCTLDFTKENGKNFTPFLPLPDSDASHDEGVAIDPGKMIDLSAALKPDGRLQWDIPEGEWTILRMSRRVTGADTRPGPAPTMGFEHDKLDKEATTKQFENFHGKLLKLLKPRAQEHGWTTIHLDSWEMGAQNWTPHLVEEFKARRGYDPTLYFVTYSGRAVQSVEVAERFLWDLRQTANELTQENYIGQLIALGDQHGLEFSNEPYGMAPVSDMDMGALADVPMCEFWNAEYGFNSCASVGHRCRRHSVPDVGWGSDRFSSTGYGDPWWLRTDS